MFELLKKIRLGICPYLLFPEAMTDERAQHIAIARTALLQDYQALDVFLSDDANLRKSEITIIKSNDKVLNYNLPGIIQLDNEYNAGSMNEKYRRNALDFVKKHINYAAEADCAILVITSCADHHGKDRPAAVEHFFDYLCKVSEYADKANLKVYIEPIERGCFKDLLFGPTAECVKLAERVQAAGFSNFGVMLDTAHLPTLNETFDSALSCYATCGVGHVHLGNCVISDRQHVYYGHKHAPLGIMGGEYDVPELAAQIRGLIDCGYLSFSKEGETVLSFETQVYPGVSPETTARVTYEKFCAALKLASGY